MIKKFVLLIVLNTVLLIHATNHRLTIPVNDNIPGSIQINWNLVRQEIRKWMSAAAIGIAGLCVSVRYACNKVGFLFESKVSCKEQMSWRQIEATHDRRGQAAPVFWSYPKK